MSDDAAKVWVALFVIVGFVAYLAPGIVAGARGHPKRNVIFALNWLLGIPVVLLILPVVNTIAPGQPKLLFVATIIPWALLLLWAALPFKKPEKSE